MSTLFSSERALTVSSPAIPQLAGRPALVPLQLSGFEAINALFEYRLVLQTPDALLPFGSALQGANFKLSDMLGREITCAIELEGHGRFVPGQPGSSGLPNQGAGSREISAIIASARMLGQASRHALYELTLRPWLHLATLSADCKVFQDQTPVQVIRAVLADYAFATELRLIETYPQRDYIVQYNETDHQFICRLMQEWGINYHFEHSGGVHRLVLSDHNGAFSPLQPGNSASAYHHIAYYPPGHKTDVEYIHALVPGQRITAGSYESREYDHTRPKLSLQAQAHAPRDSGHSEQDVFLWRGGQQIGGGGGEGGSGWGAGSGFGSGFDDGAVHLAASDWSQPNAGADKAANRTEPQGQHLARLRMQALRQGGQRARGSAHVRGIAAGCTFRLQHHPQEAANTEYLTLATRLLVENVSEDTGRSAGHVGGVGGLGGLSPSALQALSDPQRLSGQWRCTVDFELQPTTELLRPGMGAQPAQPKPHIPGPETAIVCGPSGDTAESNIYTDSLGRIKVQFPWDRYGRSDHNSSCWVRVASAWAGNQLGSMHIPRVGQEVIVSFIGGDIDRPLCTGRVFNQDNLPPWRLPQQQALSGIRSRELKPGGGNSAAGRSNHLVMDDSDGQIQTQLQSDHQHSTLSLGHITRIEDHAGRKDHRGEGFELRTDRHGAVRAQDGLILSTEGRPKASGHITSLDESAARLSQGQSQHEALGQLAQQHQAHEAGDQDAVAKALQEQNQEIAGQGPAAQGQFPELSEPHLLIASPAGIESTTAQSTHQHSGQHHAISSGGHTSVSSGKSWLVSANEAIRMFSYKMGVKLVSAACDVEFKAMDASINLLAKLKITATATSIHIEAKEEVVINGGGSYTVFNSSGIEDGTSGSWAAHAASHSMPGGKSLGVPNTEQALAPHFSGKFQITDKNTGAVLRNKRYRIKMPNDKYIEGITDEKGYTNAIGGRHANSYDIEIES
jgi:type VI secretion system secreted protein VgrG